jgi:hypothetical protein
MAGFELRGLDIDSKNKSTFRTIPRNIQYLSALGMKWDDKIIKQSRSIGVAEEENAGMSPYSLMGAYTQADPTQKEFIAFYDSEYATRRDFLRRFAMNGEIEYVLDVIADETIVYDDNNYFVYPNTKNLKSVIKAEKAREIIEDLNNAFKKVYFTFGFNGGDDAWSYLKKFLIDGFLAFEIIYDENEKGEATEIIEFKEMDPISLRTEIRKTEDDNDIRVWIQHEGDPKLQRELLDANVIYISWAKSNFISRLSYVERLVRSFNMLRTLENSRLIWNVWNSQNRTVIKVPIGTQNEAKARTRLNELRAYYKEDIMINYDSGEVTINGQPNFSFAKTFMIPFREAGGSVDISQVKPEGYDMNNTDQLKYFWLKFITDSKVPGNRMNLGGESGGNPATWNAGAEGLIREEMRFDYFKKRIRSMYQEILLKPTWLQFCLKHPEFAKDKVLKGSLGMAYVEENLYTLAKSREIADKGATLISNLSNIKEDIVDSTGAITQRQFLDPKFMIEKWMTLTDTDFKLNDKYKKQRAEEIRKLQYMYSKVNKGEEGAAGNEFGGGLGAEFGGGLGGEETGLGGETEGGEEEPIF